VAQKRGRSLNRTFNYEQRKKKIPERTARGGHRKKREKAPWWEKSLSADPEKNQNKRKVVQKMSNRKGKSLFEKKVEMVEQGKEVDGRKRFRIDWGDEAGVECRQSVGKGEQAGKGGKKKEPLYTGGSKKRRWRKK